MKNNVSMEIQQVLKKAYTAATVGKGTVLTGCDTPSRITWEPNKTRKIFMVPTPDKIKKHSLMPIQQYPARALSVPIRVWVGIIRMLGTNPIYVANVNRIRCIMTITK